MIRFRTWIMEKGHTQDHMNGKCRWNAPFSLHCELLRNSHFLQPPTSYNFGVENRRKGWEKSGAASYFLGDGCIYPDSLFPFQGTCFYRVNVAWIRKKTNQPKIPHEIPPLFHTKRFSSVSQLFLWKAIKATSVPVSCSQQSSIARCLRA